MNLFFKEKLSSKGGFVVLRKNDDKSTSFVPTVYQTLRTALFYGAPYNITVKYAVLDIYSHEIVFSNENEVNPYR